MHEVVFLFYKEMEVISFTALKQSIILYHSIIVIRVSIFHKLTNQSHPLFMFVNHLHLGSTTDCWGFHTVK